MINNSANVTASQRHHQKAKLGILALSVIALSTVCLACLVRDTGERCGGNSEAKYSECINYVTHPARITCEETEKGSQACQTSEVACLKDWQQQEPHLAGTPPYPQITTNYCCNPGPWHYDEPAGTTLNSVANAVPCPGS